ncbi:hypothetical protein B0H17DRAFT_1142723 [Mycena rosella]|uniref:Uncharacterized protein n=1 Tax=Mycena rosella TaxID=1033263 RepID=A0AAD7G7N9_MYCRO|nr:hypothetical protein B0H17DRAFT_1142723 [Mycena rosella]
MILTTRDIDAAVQEIEALWTELNRVIAEKDAIVGRCIRNDLRLLDLANKKDDFLDRLQVWLCPTTATSSGCSAVAQDALHEAKAGRARRGPRGEAREVAKGGQCCRRARYVGH